MSVLVYVSAETAGAKAAHEVVSYAKKLGDEVIVVASGKSDALAGLGKFGASKVLADANVASEDSRQVTTLVQKAVEATGANIIVFSHDLVAKAVAPRLSVRLKAGLASGAVAVPEGNKVKVNVFSGKAFGEVELKTDKKIIALLPNSFSPEATGSDCAVEDFSANAGAQAVKITDRKIPEGEVPLPEAELVVSGGRGLKGPENWEMIEDLAHALGAATACSRPVADADWRPHHEHVGQTGLTIRPNLYIAVGISGAIQHLAGVNGSKTIVVINSDKEAPFFKAADYGVVGDAFEIVPKLTAAVKKLKGN